MIWCAACASVDSEVASSACPFAPVYDTAFTLRLADEVAQLPDGAAMLIAIGDCAVLREQVRVCRDGALSAGESAQ
jgi:hypothetical protein